METECTGLWISESDTDTEYGDRDPRDGHSEAVRLSLVPSTERYRVEREYARRGQEPAYQQREVDTADECITTLREMCDGQLSDIARICLWSASHDAMTGEVVDHPSFAAAFAAAKLRAPRLIGVPR